MGWDPKPDPLQKLLCISCNISYNLSAASSNPSPCALDKPVQKWEIQHCVIYSAANAISIKTHVGWYLVHSCSGQLSQYFDTLSMTNNFLMLKSIIFITRKYYAKSEVHLSRIILTKITTNFRFINPVAGNYTRKEWCPCLFEGLEEYLQPFLESPSLESQKILILLYFGDKLIKSKLTRWMSGSTARWGRAAHCLGIWFPAKHQSKMQSSEWLSLLSLSKASLCAGVHILLLIC